MDIDTYAYFFNFICISMREMESRAQFFDYSYILLTKTLTGKIIHVKETGSIFNLTKGKKSTNP